MPPALDDSWQVTVLYARNLTMSTTEHHLCILFSLQGSLHLDKVKKIRDFAFIHYFTRNEAEVALNELNGIIVDNSPIEVTWAKPPDCCPKRRSRNGNTDDNNRCFSFSNGPTTMDNFDHSIDLSLPTNGRPVLRSNNIPSKLSLRGRHSKPRGTHGQKMSSGSRNFMNKCPQILLHLCRQKGWGDPIFQIRYSQDPFDNTPLFTCKAIIPGLPVEINNFLPTKFSKHPGEAQAVTAHFALTKLGLCNEAILNLELPRELGFPSYTAMNGFPHSYGQHTLTNRLDFEKGATCRATAQAMTPSYNTPIGTQRKYTAQAQQSMNIGQGDAHNLHLLPPSQAMSSAYEQAHSSMWNSTTVIEPNSILGMLIAATAASGMEVPYY